MGAATRPNAPFGTGGHKSLNLGKTICCRGELPPARRQFGGFAPAFDTQTAYQQERHDYESSLLEADIFVSTADHEFFGIRILEGLAAGAFPLVPEKLAYPETLKLDASNEDFYYKHVADQLPESWFYCLRKSGTTTCGMATLIVQSAS
jgi:hypothetical protein